MRAARFHGREDIRIDEIPEPQCGANQVKVKPAFVGICGTGIFPYFESCRKDKVTYTCTDIHEYLGGPVFVPTTPHPVTRETIPITLGHEFSAIITEVGSEVTEISPGQHVVILYA